MTYKNKIFTLSGVIAALAVVYILTIVFDPQRRGTRSDLYSWLEPGQNDRITGISIKKEGETASPETASQETVNLSRNGGKWFVTRGATDYPARQARVEDLLAILSKRAPYPVRSSSASSHERLSLTPDKAAQITVSAGAGLPVLSLLIGQADITGQNVYLRKQGQNEVRSGEDKFSLYTSSLASAWFNLRLFPENEEGKLNESDIQRLIVYPPEEETPMIFTRSGREWTFNFSLSNPDFIKVDSYLREILTLSGEDFADDISSSDSMFNASRIILELGSGVSKTLRVSPADEKGRRYATVSGADYVYSIPAWAGNRLFTGREDFELEKKE
jgi:hypothetical protein